MSRFGGGRPVTNSVSCDDVSTDCGNIADSDYEQRNTSVCCGHCDGNYNNNYVIIIIIIVSFFFPPILVCLFATCPNNAKCFSAPPSFQCLCNNGYTKSGDVCVGETIFVPFISDLNYPLPHLSSSPSSSSSPLLDIDECSLNHDCPVNSTCKNVEGSFTCNCPEFYTIGMVNGIKKCIGETLLK